ncbi:hypothetical protein RQP46_006182 [Phenoliferia psychrophenolica]
MIPSHFITILVISTKSLWTRRPSFRFHRLSPPSRQPTLFAHSVFTTMPLPATGAASPLLGVASLAPLPPVAHRPNRRVRRLKHSLSHPVDASTLGLALPPSAHLVDQKQSTSPSSATSPRSPFARAYPFPLPPSTSNPASGSGGVPGAGNVAPAPATPSPVEPAPVVPAAPAAAPAQPKAPASPLLLPLPADSKAQTKPKHIAHRRKTSSLRQPSSLPAIGGGGGRFAPPREDSGGKGRGLPADQIYRGLPIKIKRDLEDIESLFKEDEEDRFADSELAIIPSALPLIAPPSSTLAPRLAPVVDFSTTLDPSLIPDLNHGNIGLGILPSTHASPPVLHHNRAGSLADRSDFNAGELPPVAHERRSVTEIAIIPVLHLDLGPILRPTPANGPLASRSEGSDNEYFSDPASPLLPSPPLSAGSAVPGLDYFHESAHKKARLPGSFPRRNSRRVYPKSPSIDLRTIPFRTRHEHDVRSPLTEPFPGTPDLSGLPGAFIASPVLPTAFADFGHSPLPTPPARFSRMRKSVTEPGTLSPNITMSSSATFSSSATSDCYSAATSSSPFAALVSSMPTSPAGTPTLGSSHVFSSSTFTDGNDADRSAPSTPVPDSHSFSHATPMPAADSSGGAAGNAQQPLLFDAAIASTIIGAIMCLGAASWLAFLFIRRRVPKVTRGISSRDSLDSDEDEKGRRFDREITYRESGYPKPPPLARLSFQRSPDRFDERDDAFQADFDQWADCDETLGGIRSREPTTEDAGRYPEMVARSGSVRSQRSLPERSASRASRTSVETSSTRQLPRRRSSLRASTTASLADSTFSRQSPRSSRTSHGNISPTPPRLPSPVGLRYSGDAALYFTAQPETPTKVRRGAQVETEPPVPILPVDFRDLVGNPLSSPPRATRSRSSSRSSGTDQAGKSPHQRNSRARAYSEEEPFIRAAADDKARKAEKRRATVDSTLGSVNVQALLLQDQLERDLAGDEDPFPYASALDSKFADRLSLSQVSSATPRPASRKSSVKKARPVTMPPVIFVSDHPQDLVPPPTSIKLRDDALDPRLSAGTYGTMPWLAKSPSSNSAFTTNFPRDDCSILDPDMRSQRHYSVETATSMASSRTARTTDRYSERMSTDSAAIRNLINTSLPLEMIAEQRSDDDKSLTSGSGSGLDVDELPDTISKRQSIVSSFPNPPTPTSPSFGSIGEIEQTKFDLDLDSFNLERIDSSTSIRALSRSRTYDPNLHLQRESDIGSVFCSPEEFVRPAKAPAVEVHAPQRPPKSSWRNSSTFEDTDTDHSSVADSHSSSSSRIPLPTRPPPFHPIVSVAPTPPSPVSTRIPTLQPRPTAPPPGSFAADLQASVGSPASGYDSDTLLSYPGIRAYGCLTDSLYASSHHSGSIESLEEVAITRAESVHIGSRSIGIPTYAWGKPARRAMNSYESDESTYDESDGEVPRWRSSSVADRLSMVAEREEH